MSARPVAQTAASAAQPSHESTQSILPDPYAPARHPSDALTDDEWVEQWLKILLSFDDIIAQLLSIQQLPQRSNAHHSITLHTLALLSRHQPAALFLLTHSTRCLPLVDRALGRLASLLQHTCTPASGYPVTLHAVSGDRLHTRPYCLPSSHTRASLGVIRANDVGHLVSVLGNVMRVQPARMYEYAAEYSCDKCHGHFYVYADDDQESRIEQPKHCRAVQQPDANRDNPSWLGHSGSKKGGGCRSTFIQQTATSLARDVQHVRIQDNLHRSHLSLPRSITLRLTDEQCESVKVGDVVQVCGMVRRQWSALVTGQHVNIDLYLDAYHIAVIGSSAASAAAASSTPNVPLSEFNAYWQHQRTVGRGLKARNQIVSAMAPTLVGMFIPKLTCMLSVIGGVKKEDGGIGGDDVNGGRGDVITIRGDIHVLLVGDAGVGKSVLLQSACGLSPRGVLTTGAGTTSAGLTVAATRAAGSRSSTAFTLEPGALVLSDSGVCCIDEFNSISKSDRTSLLEAMEQQTISIAKGGQVTKLNTRTAVIAALNPKQGKYDHDLDLSVNTALGSALLSRFDVILALLDTRDDEWDAKVAEQLLQVLPTANGSSSGGGVKKQEKEELSLDEMKDDEDEVLCITQRATQRLAMTQQPVASVSQLLTSRWSVATVHSYIAYLKSSFFPVLSPACESVLKRYYQVQRRSDGRKQARVGVRLLESLIRLTQSHARLMWRRDECELLDAVMAVVVMEHSVLSCGLLTKRRNKPLTWTSAVMPTTVSALHAQFSAEPDAEYEAWESVILDQLGLAELGSRVRSSDDGGVSGGGGAGQSGPQQPTVYSFHMASSQQPRHPIMSFPPAWPLPPSLTVLPASAPQPRPPLPPPTVIPVRKPPPPQQTFVVPAPPPPPPSRPPVPSMPPARHLSTAPTQPLPPQPRQPSTAAAVPYQPPTVPVSILRGPSTSAAPPTGRLLSRKATVSFAGMLPPSPLSVASSPVSSAPVAPPHPAPAAPPPPQVSQSFDQPSQPDLFTLPSQPSSPSQRLRSNPFTTTTTTTQPTSRPVVPVPSQPRPANTATLPPNPPSPQPATPVKPSSHPSTFSTPASRSPLAPLNSPASLAYSTSTHPNLPSLPPTPATVPSPLSGMLGGSSTRVLPLPRSGVLGVSGMSLSSNFAAAIKANPFISSASGGSSGGSRWSTGITDEELDGLDLGL